MTNNIYLFFDKKSKKEIEVRVLREPIASVLKVKDVKTGDIFLCSKSEVYEGVEDV